MVCVHLVMYILNRFRQFDSYHDHRQRHIYCRMIATIPAMSACCGFCYHALDGNGDGIGADLGWLAVVAGVSCSEPAERAMPAPPHHFVVDKYSDWSWHPAYDGVLLPVSVANNALVIDVCCPPIGSLHRNTSTLSICLMVSMMDVWEEGKE